MGSRGGVGVALGLSLHRPWCPLASHRPVSFLCLLALSFPLYFPFLSLGRLCQRSPRTFPVSLLCVGSTQRTFALCGVGGSSAGIEASDTRTGGSRAGVNAASPSPSTTSGVLPCSIRSRTSTYAVEFPAGNQASGRVPADVWNSRQASRCVQAGGQGLRMVSRRNCGRPNSGHQSSYKPWSDEYDEKTGRSHRETYCALNASLAGH